MRLLRLLAILLLPAVAHADVLVSWTASVSTPSTPVGGYAVQRADTCAGTFVKLADVGPTVTSYRHVGATDGAYRVTAWNSVGFKESTCVVAQSGTVVLPPPPPPPPVNVLTDLRVTGVTAQAMTVLRTVPPGHRIAIRVAPAPINWGSAIQAPCLTTPCLITGLQKLTNYQVQAVLYTGTLSVDAAFGPITAPVAFRTSDGPVVEPPPIEPPPPAGPGLKNIRTGTFRNKSAVFIDVDKTVCTKGTKRYVPTPTSIVITCER
jgi:hypothetical protein